MRKTGATCSPCRSAESGKSRFTRDLRPGSSDSPGSTRIIATLIAVYGVFMAALGWNWAMFVLGYALSWFLVNNRVKLLAYRVLDPAAALLLGKKSAGLDWPATHCAWAP